MIYSRTTAVRCGVVQCSAVRCGGVPQLSVVELLSQRLNLRSGSGRDGGIQKKNNNNEKEEEKGRGKR